MNVDIHDCNPVGVVTWETQWVTGYPMGVLREFPM